MARILFILLFLTSPLAAADYRTLEGQHITLLTDVPANAEVDALPAIFDQAFDQWCDYFNLKPADHADWRVRGILLKDRASRERFIAAGQMPPDLWDFKSGYSLGRELWLYDQTSPYYRRHLLLHEGVHCFMYTLLGGIGPPWYGEGMAELLATHKLDGDKLTVNYFPHRREEVPKLGRIEMVRQAMSQGKGMSLDAITGFDSTAHRQNEPYGWCWGAAAFLDGHPRYRKRFRTLADDARRPDFADEFARKFKADRALMEEEFQIYLTNLGYAYDFPRLALELKPGEAVPAKGATIEVAADRGWQSSAIRLEAGETYKIQPQGRFQVAKTTKPWLSEAGGVTIRYINGQPLGALLGAVRPDDFDSTKGTTPLAAPQTIGLGTALKPQQSGTLYLRINDAPGELADNAGSVKVNVRKD